MSHVVSNDTFTVYFFVSVIDDQSTNANLLSLDNQMKDVEDVQHALKTALRTPLPNDSGVRDY
jgi:hypothetical protein